MDGVRQVSLSNFGDLIMHFTHALVLFAYVLIATQFALAFFFNRQRRGRLPLLLLALIFVLCAVTRFTLEFQILSVLTYALHAVLLVASIGFVLTNQAAIIVDSLQKTDIKPDPTKLDIKEKGR